MTMADEINEAARLMAEPIPTGPDRALRELRIVVNARMQTHAVTRDRAGREGRNHTRDHNSGAVEALSWVIGLIDAELDAPTGGDDGE